MSETKPINSLLRGMELVQMLSDEPHGLRLNEISERMGLKTPTVHNLIKTLCMRGWLEKRNTNLYGTGPALLEIGDTIHRNQQHLQAEVIVRRLATHYLGPVVNFSIPTQDNIVVRLRMSPDRPNTIQRPIGKTNSLYSTGTGLAFLAWAAPDQVTQMREQQPFHDIGIRLWESPEALERYLDETRKVGYAETRFPGQDLYRVASVVRDANDVPISYIGVAVSASKVESPIERKALAAVVRDAAEDLSKLNKKAA